jgi:GWxTD domain-containing protein
MRKIDIRLVDFTLRPLDVSTLLFVDEIVIDSIGNEIIVPNVLKNYGDSQSSMYVWYEIYNQLKLDSLSISYRILNRKEKTIRKGDYTIPLTGQRTTDTLHLMRGDLESGKYRLELVFGKEDYAVRQVNDFTIQWLGMPAFTSDIDQAILQLKYIANSGEIRKMKKAKEDEKENLFMQFWQERDPTPGTKRNELMDEYYRRIYYSNSAFTSLIKGWQSDRGMIYVIFGPPDEVERHPFDPDMKPYEVWAYYEFGRAFVFIDYSGFGDYQLTQEGWRTMNEFR